MQWFIARKNGRPGSVEEAEIGRESDEENVRIITVHKSKGLEFDIVYCPYLTDGLSSRRSGAQFFHHPERNLDACIDLGGPDFEAHKRHAEAEEMAENLRLAYVALTRSRHRTVVVYGAFHQTATSPLGYLLHRERPEENLAGLKARIKQMTDDALLADLDRLIGASNGTISRSSFTSTRTGNLFIEKQTGPLSSRRLTRSVPLPLVTTSFTRLMEYDVPTTGEVRRDGEFDEKDPLAVLSTVDTSPSPRKGGNEAPVKADAPQLALGLLGWSPKGSARSLPLADFPRGPQAGTLLHLVFERIDFRTPDAGENREQVAAILRGFEFDARWIDPISDMVRSVVRTALPGDDGLRLEKIGPSKRLNELGFLFPTSRRRAGLLSDIAGVLECRSGIVPPEYPPALAARNRPVDDGFLKGFIDLVFEYRGRYYIVDYKSNHLGDRASDYGENAMQRAMAEHHYYVQYHLYAVALHRYLSSRLSGYVFDTHFGGVYYLFVRGVTGEGASGGFGVFYDRPDAEAITRLSSLFSWETHQRIGDGDAVR
jgi:exodeoxyribonuclease V beta subunit